MRAALLPPPLDRDETYSASTRYAARSRRSSAAGAHGGAAPADGHAIGHRREPRRPRDAARAPRAPRPLRRRSSSSRAASSAARSTRQERGFRASRASRASSAGVRRRRPATPTRSRSRSRAAPARRTSTTTAPSAARWPARATPSAASSTATPTTGSRGATRSSRTSPSCSSAVGVRRGASRARGGGVIAYGHYGRPLLAFPSRAGPALAVRGARDGRRGRRPDRRRPRQALLRRQLRLVAAGTTRRLPLEERARRHGALRGLDPRARRAVDPRRLRRRRRADRDRAAASAPTTPPTSRSSAPTCSRSRSARAASTTSRSSAGATAATRLLQQPGGLRRAPRRRPPRLAARAGRPRCSSCGQGQWEDTTGALERRTGSPRCSGRRASAHELDLWGHDVPHDWPAWRAQLAHHLPRFC